MHDTVQIVDFYAASHRTLIDKELGYVSRNWDWSKTYLQSWPVCTVL